MSAPIVSSPGTATGREEQPFTLDVESLHGRRATDRWNRMVVGDVFERLTWSHPDRDAIVAWSGAYAHERFARVTYRQAAAEVSRIANALLAAGLQRSDRVLLYCENSTEALLTLFGIAQAGLVAAPVNPLLAPDVLASVIALVEPAFTIVDAELWPRAASSFAAAGRGVDVTIAIGGGTIEGSAEFTSWMGDAPTEEPAPQPAPHGDDVWSLLFTSGTTSLPKASMATHAYSYTAANSYALSFTRGLRFEDELRLMTFLPIIYHCGHNCAFAAFFAGGSLILGRRPDPQATAAAVTAEQPTAIWGGSPMFLKGIADAAEQDPTHDLTSLRVALFSWGAMPPATAAALKRVCGADLGLVEVFGQTEAMSCFRFWIDQHPDKYLATAPAVNVVGVPNPALGAAIMDVDGALITEAGVPGEAVYRSPAVTAGYYRDPVATAEVFAHGWFHSGDSTRYDDDGLQVMVDRLKDIVKSGGENVSSIRVEAVLAQHPAVERAAVIGVPHERWGEMVTGVVVLRPGLTASEAELIAHCRVHLAGYESPKQIVFVTEMPQTVGGKLLKYRLRALLGDAPPNP